MIKKIYRIKAGMYRFTDLFNLDQEYVMDQVEKTKFDQIVDSFKGNQNAFDLSMLTIEAYPIGHLIESNGTDIFGITSLTTVSIPANRVYIEPFKYY